MRDPAARLHLFLSSPALAWPEAIGRASALPRRLARALAWWGEAASAAGLFSAVLSVYLATAPRSLASADSAELTTAAATLGVPHPPGYPLYVLVGRVFAMLPVGEVAFRLNLMSAVFGALAALAVYAIVLELTRHRFEALVAALSLAFSYHFWGESLVAEVYTLDAALLGGVLYALSVWQRTRSQVALSAAFALLGLSLAHRPTSVLLTPPLLMWAVTDGAPRQPGPWLKALPWALPGAALYFFLPAASLFGWGHMWNVGYQLDGEPTYVDLATASGFRWYVTAEIFRPLAFAYGPRELLAEAGTYLGWLQAEFTGAGVVLGLLGLVRAVRRRGFFYLSAGTFALLVWFHVSYKAADKDQMFLATYLIWAVWLGLGTNALLDLAAGGYARSLAVAATRAVAVAVPIALLAANYGAVDFPGQDSLRTETDRVFALARPDAMIIGHWTDITPLEYAQVVGKRRPDLTLIARWSLSDEHLRRLIRSNIDERPVYLLYEAAALRDEFRLVPLGSWFRLEPRAEEGDG